MTSVADPKAYWDLFETVWWIRSRDEVWVAKMEDKSEADKAALAWFGLKPELKLLPPLDLPGAVFYDDRRLISPQENEEPAPSAESIPLDQALDDLFKKVSSGRVRMTAVRGEGSSDEQIPVPLAELNGLGFRIRVGSRVVHVGLWSRSRGSLAWRSLQFLRSDVISAWPPLEQRKTAAASRAILFHLREIMTPEAPLTKSVARQRCMAEVPHAYPEAFKRAWAELEPACKRGRGKHGPRSH